MPKISICGILTDVSEGCILEKAVQEHTDDQEIISEENVDSSTSVNESDTNES